MNSTFDPRWKSSFGAPPEVCFVLWNKINPYKTIPAGIDPKHILQALLFLTVYDTEQNSSQRLGNMDVKAHCKWPKLFVIVILYLECKVVSTHPIQHFFPREYCALSQLIPHNSHRSYGTINFWVILATRHWSRLMVLICLLRRSFLRSSCPINSKGMDLSTKLVYELPQGELSGFMDQLELAKMILGLLDRHLSHF